MTLRSKAACTQRVWYATRATGEKAGLCRGFKVPGSNLVRAPFVVSFSVCITTSRLSEIIRTGTRILEKKVTEFMMKPRNKAHVFVALPFPEYSIFADTVTLLQAFAAHVVYECRRKGKRIRRRRKVTDVQAPPRVSTSAYMSLRSSSCVRGKMVKN